MTVSKNHHEKGVQLLLGRGVEIDDSTTEEAMERAA
jgi:hypothetical protein